MPVRTDIQITGVKQAGYAGKKMAKADSIRLNNGLLDAGKIILTEALRLVPRETGDLAASGQVHVTGRGMFASVEVFFGGPNAPYAWIVHNDILAYHAPPTQAMFLSHAVDNTKKQCREAIRREFRSQTIPIEKGLR